MFVNLTNHPSKIWSKEQLYAAHRYGSIVDICFPNIEPSFSSLKVKKIAESTVDRITALGKDITVHIMGEMTFTFMVVTRLKELGIKCVASTTERKTTYNDDGTKVSEFQFVKFREY